MLAPLILDCRGLPPTFHAHERAWNERVLGSHFCPDVILVGEFFAADILENIERRGGDTTKLVFKGKPVITELPEIPK